MDAIMKNTTQTISSQEVLESSKYDKLYVNTGDKILAYDMNQNSTQRCSFEGTALQFKQSCEEVWIEIFTRDNYI